MFGRIGSNVQGEECVFVPGGSYKERNVFFFTGPFGKVQILSVLQKTDMNFNGFHRRLQNHR